MDPRRLLATLAVALALFAPGWAGAEEPIEPARVEAIERIIENYILEHPEIVMRALRVLEERQQAEREAAIRLAVAAHSDDIFNDPAAPTTGNPDGDVSVVEFFDYRCPYCKRVVGPILEAVAADGNVRLVFKEFPILGAESYFAARAALAAVRQGRYRAFHVALMALEGDLDAPVVMGVAARLGLDLDRLRADMDRPEVKAAIARNQALADALYIEGTPAFVIGDAVVPGALSIETFRRLIAEARAG